MPKKSQASNDPASKTFEEVYTDYLRQLGEIWDELVKQIGEAQRTCSASAAKAGSQMGEAQAASEAALRTYVDAVRAAWEEAQRKYSDAYASYVGAHRDAWTNTSPPDMSPQTLAAVAHSAAAAAGYASATIGNWSLIEWAGVPPWVLSTAKSS